MVEVKKATNKKVSAKKAPAKKPTVKQAATTKMPTLKKVQKTEGEFAVIETGGKQYMVSEGERVKIEKITGKFKEGDKITFDKILLVDNGKDTTIGTPYISGAKVKATLEEISRHKKINVIRFKSKSRYFKKRGHRQPYFQVHIDALK